MFQYIRKLSAGEQTSVAVSGSTVMVMETAFTGSTGSGDVNLIGENEEGQRLLDADLTETESVKVTTSITRLRLTNLESSEIRVRVLVGDGIANTNRQGGEVDATITGQPIGVRKVVPNTLTGSGDISISDATTNTINANSNREELTLQMDRGNTGILTLQDGNGNAFAVLDAGESVTIPGESALQVSNNSGTTQTYRYVEAEVQ